MCRRAWRRRTDLRRWRGRERGRGLRRVLEWGFLLVSRLLDRRIRGQRWLSFYALPADANFDNSESNRTLKEDLKAAVRKRKAQDKLPTLVAEIGCGVFQRRTDSGTLLDHATLIYRNRHVSPLLHW